MITKEHVNKIVDNFNMRIDIAKNESDKNDGSFEHAIANLNHSRECIDALQHIVNEMKQEEHDLTQDVYNRFKNKGYVSTIKF